MPKRAIRVLIKGRVQGVAFRAWTRDQAVARGLAGWVRNRADGAVEAVFAGSDDAVDAMLGLCRRGPPAARVEAIETSETAAPANGRVFEIRR